MAKPSDSSGSRARARRELRRAQIGFRRLRRSHHVVLSLLAVLVGAVSGFVAIGFILLITAIKDATIGDAPAHASVSLAGVPWWQVLLAPVLAGLVVGLVVRYLMPEKRPLGVADVIEAAALRAGRMSLTSAVRALFVNAVSIGCGGSAGREGPVVHMGAALGSWIAKRLRLSRSLTMTLLGCGVAAAVAASFNAPIAGAFFALEVVIGHYTLRAFAPVVIASVTGTVVSRSVFGDFPAFIKPVYEIASFWEFPAFALLGVVSAVTAYVFMRGIVTLQDLEPRLPGPGWLHPAMGGLAVGGIAMVFPQVLGVGYEVTDAALNERLGLELLIGLAVAKIAATAITLGSGMGGGVFSPSLVVGALSGGAFGIIATQVFPELSSGPGAYTLVGMGAVAGAVLGAPISTILIVFELTGDYKITVAVMVAVVIASVVTQQLAGRSIFAWQLEKRGIRLHGGHEIGLLRDQLVRHVMALDYATVPPDAKPGDVRIALMHAPYGEVLVVGRDGALLGVINLSDLSEAAFDTSMDALLRADEIARRVRVFEAGDNLEHAHSVFLATRETHIPVVEDRDSMHLVGMLHEREVFIAYERALLRARAEERGEPYLPPGM